MAFTWLGSMSGKNDPLVMKLPIYNLAVRKGALLSYVPGAASVTILATDAGTTPIVGIAQETTTTASTATATKIEVLILNNGDMIEGDVYEIKNASTLTASNATTTKSTFVDASFVAGTDNVLIGAKFVVLTSTYTGSHPVGAVLTATDYASSSGTITFPAVATGFKTGDTIKLISLGKDYATNWKGLAIEATYGDTFTLDQTGAGAGSVVKGFDVSDDGKKIRAVVTNGLDSMTTLVTS